MLKYLSLYLFFCAVLEIRCWSSDNSNGYRSSEYNRNKRAKYYSIPSYKYNSRPTYSYSNRSPLYSSSYGYMSNDIGLVSKSRPYKVSKRPINEGLGDDDFNNLIKYLSHKDLNKIVEFAAEKERYPDRFRDSGGFEYGSDFDSNDYEEDSPKVYPYNPDIQFDYKYKNVEYRPNMNYPQVQDNMNTMYSPILINTGQEDTEKLSLLDEYIQREINVMSNKNNLFTDSNTMKEEELPKPLNLREDDYDVSFTNNVPSIAKLETRYRLENFADLPLMEYENSKLEKVNSYNVPHYSVISSSNPRPRPLSPPQHQSSQSSSSPLSSSILSLINAPEVEPAPPVSTAKEQSDAHLKAIKIWTHKSKGTAYTLHDDGTLSLEQPSLPRYSHP